jgi:hypothetical protein
VTVTTPPRRPETDQDRELEQRVAELEALIEEARRRARRRRSVYAAVVLAALGVGVWASSGFGGHGGGGAGTAASARARASSGSHVRLSAAVVAPPTCSEVSSPTVDSGGRAGRTFWVAVPAIWDDRTWPTFFRWCGPATVGLRAHGRSLRIRSGFCSTSPSWRGYQLDVGLIGRVPAAPARFLELLVHNRRVVRGGTFPAFAYMQLEGRTFATTNPSWRLVSPLLPAPLAAGAITRATVTIAKSLRAGTFAFHLRDASQITGSWTCGENPYIDH